MRKSLLVPLALALLATGCSEQEPAIERVQSIDIGDPASDEAPQNEFGFAEAMEQPTIPLPGAASMQNSARSADAAAASAARAANAAATPDSVPADAPVARQIAYAYSWGFRVDGDSLRVLQQRHRALCEEMGPDCRMLSLSQSDDAVSVYGTIRLQVAATRATEFGEQLTASTEGVDAEQVSFAISGDDLTDQITDTEAHLAGRRLLRDRLMEVLRTRQGTVADLVAAERGVAEVNEEIDAATARLATMRASVAFSSVEIEYDPMLGQYRLGFARPITEALANAGSTLGVVIGGLIYLVVALAPILAFLLGLRWIFHRFGLRLRWWLNETRPVAAAAPEAEAGEETAPQ